jgi:hypothetical protein
MNNHWKKISGSEIVKCYHTIRDVPITGISLPNYVPTNFWDHFAYAVRCVPSVVGGSSSLTTGRILMKVCVNIPIDIHIMQKKSFFKFGPSKCPFLGKKAQIGLLSHKMVIFSKIVQTFFL